MCCECVTSCNAWVIARPSLSSYSCCRVSSCLPGKPSWRGSKSDEQGVCGTTVISFGMFWHNSSAVRRTGELWTSRRPSAYSNCPSEWSEATNAIFLAVVLSLEVFACQRSSWLKGRSCVFYFWRPLWELNNFNAFALYSFLLPSPTGKVSVKNAALVNVLYKVVQSHSRKKNCIWKRFKQRKRWENKRERKVCLSYIRRQRDKIHHRTIQICRC